MKPNVSIVVAIASKTRAIGNGSSLLFRISDDLKRFKALTLGHSIVMGRKTFESIGRTLPGRKNFIVTRNPDYVLPPGSDAVICTSIEEAIERAWEQELRTENARKEIFLIGGGEIYEQGLPFTSKIYLTVVESDASGDIFFPEYGEFGKITFKEDRLDEKTGLRYSWIDLVR